MKKHARHKQEHGAYEKMRRKHLKIGVFLMSYLSVAMGSVNKNSSRCIMKILNLTVTYIYRLIRKCDSFD